MLYEQNKKFISLLSFNTKFIFYILWLEIKGTVYAKYLRRIKVVDLKVHK